ncbi:MAG: DUF4159 domain-containing protein [Planctomycetota bacterium]
MAWPLEWFITAGTAGALGQRLLDLLFAATWFVHRCVGWILVFIGRMARRVACLLPWQVRLALLAVLLLAVVAALSRLTEGWVLAKLDFSPKQAAIIANSGLAGSLRSAVKLYGFATWLFALAPAAAFIRSRYAYYYLLLVGAGFLALWLIPLAFILDVPGRLFVAPGSDLGKTARNLWWVTGFFAWLPAAGCGVVFCLCLATRATKAYYFRAPQAQEALGDRLYRSFVTNGSDPVFRTSFYWAAGLHFFVLVLYPLYKMYARGEEMLPYALPKGRGMPTIQGVMVASQQTKKQRPKQKTKRIKFVLNMNSAIVFTRPDIDDSRVGEEIEQDTSDTYVATSFATDSSGGKGHGGPGGGGSGLGAGGPGRGGWPNGMENARVRFIRLQYEGGDWDQDMGLNADYNLLLMFSKYTGFKVANNTEAIPISALRRFPKNRAPPFVYICGSGNIAATNDDVKALRWYCTEEAGLVIADNGGGSFNGSIRALVKRVFPELDWVDIANDDVIFRQPFVFRNGAPPLWHYSGTRALGIKFSGRWVVFYHQGDMKDAWKTGHSGTTEAQATQAYQLGINVMNYAFNQYMAAHFGQ